MLALYLNLLENDCDKDLFSALYVTYERKMFAVAYQILTDHSLAEDAVHDAFMKAIEHFELCKKISCNKRGGWLVIIVRNIALDLRRRRFHEVPCENMADAISCQPEQRDALSRALQLIQLLPESYRVVLELKCVAGWSDSEIASFLKMPSGSVRSKISRGRKLLRDKLEDEIFYDRC